MIRGIKLFGPKTYFDNPVDIDLFWDENADESKKQKKGDKKYSVIYGKNGSGKTSISKGFYSYKNDLGIYDTVEFYDDNLNEVSIDKTNLYVFNEQFVNDNVQISSENDTVNAIVLFGKAKDVDNQINEIKKKIETTNVEINKIDLLKYHQKKNPKSIDDCKDKIKEQLKNSWALREKEIKAMEKNAPVRDDFVNELIRVSKPKSSQKELTKELNDLLEKINKTRNSGDLLDVYVNTINLKNSKYYNDLVCTTFNKKESTGFAKIVLDNLEKNSSKYLNDTRDVLEHYDVCPVCFQKITNSHKKELEDVLSSLFDKTIEDAISNLNNEIIAVNNKPDMLVYNNKVSINSLKQFNDSYDLIMDDINKLNTVLKEKIGSIYVEHDELSFDLDKDYEEYLSAVKALNDEINAFNKDINARETNIKTAISLNKEIAYYDVETYLKLYNQLSKEEIEETDKFNKLKKENEENENKVKELTSTKNDYGIALEEINKCLSVIFGTKNKVSLKPNENGDRYYIYSRGRKIKYNKLSTGERNILGLVYFYELMKEKCNQNEYFKDESILIIDDPISSFDYENKIGILSFLKKILSELHTGNENSQAIIFTHELEVANYISRIYIDLNLGKDMCAREIVNKGSKRINPTKYTSYGNLLISVYQYIIDESIRDTNAIGNTIRRMVEAYSFFNYNETMDRFLAKPEYYNKIKDVELKNYFSNRMDRLLMNEASHSENVVRQISDTMNFDLFADDDIVKVAKDMICFLYSLDSSHVLRYLANEPLAKRNIDSWITEIKTSIA